MKAILIEDCAHCPHVRHPACGEWVNGVKIRCDHLRAVLCWTGANGGKADLVLIKNFPKPPKWCPLVNCDSPPVELVPTFSGEQFQEFVDYPVIVESWDKKNFGRGKRRWLAEFTEEERKIIEEWHKHFHSWHIRHGRRFRVKCRMHLIPILQKACNFFARI